MHNPDLAEVRQRNNSKGGKRGGRGRPQAELASIKDQLQTLADSVLAGDVERADAAVCGQLLNVKLRAVEIERKIKETEELEERLAALEDASSMNQRGYGARHG